MKTVNDARDLRKVAGSIVMAAGFFDGVHRGHLKVIAQTQEAARAAAGEAWILTFDTHPLRILNPEAAPKLLTANRHKLALLERTGIDGCLLLPFTRKQAAVEPEAFVENLLNRAPNLTRLVVGRNWRFGRHARGTPALVARLGREHGLAVTVVRPMVHNGETISSTRIRAEILRGNLDEVAVMLGRPFSILGTVAGGRRLGRRIGFPTANLDPHNEVLPPHGVYAVRAVVEGAPCDGVINFGVRPTVEQGRALPTLELHIFDFNGNLYGKDIEVFFVAFLRQERRFKSLDAMREQIARDAAAARAVLVEKKPKESLYTHGNAVLYSAPDKQKKKE